jgi:hypothetical protein
MTIHLPADLENSVRAAVLKGHFATEDDLVAAAVRAYLRPQHDPPPGITNERQVELNNTAEDHSDSGDGSNDGDWSDELNERRIELIDKDIQTNITTEERAELTELQRKAVAYRDRVAPLPIEGARRLHQQLLEKKLQREGS